jgi:hypothetical protein
MSLSRAESAKINGSKSQGPKTPKGKLISAMNAVRHGLRSNKLVVLDNEMPAVFDRLHQAFLDKFNPQDDAEKELVMQAASARWRLRRVWQIESSLINIEMAEQREAVQGEVETVNEDVLQASAFKSLVDESRSLSLLTRYEMALSREYDRAIKSLDRARAERTPPSGGRPSGPASPSRRRPYLATDPIRASDPGPYAEAKIPNEPNSAGKLNVGAKLHVFPASPREARPQPKAPQPAAFPRAA